MNTAEIRVCSEVEKTLMRQLVLLLNCYEVLYVSGKW